MASTSTFHAASLSPLDLPEIRTHIAQYLHSSKHDLCSCILVSKTWRTDFIPQLWHTIHFDSSLSYYLSQKNFRQHEHLVRELVIHDPVFILERWPGPSCRHISRLEYRPYIAQRQWIAPNYTSSGEQTSSDESYQGNFDDDLDSTFDDDLKNDNNSTSNSTSTTNNTSGSSRKMDSTSMSIRGFLQLVRQQTSLSHLNEDWSLHSKEHTLRFARGFIRCLHPNLVSLQITKWKISVPEMNMLIKNCPRLEQLFLRSVEIVPVNSDFNTAAFPDLQDEENEEEAETEQVEEGQVNELGQAITTTDSASVLDFRQIKGIHIDQIVLHTNRLSFRGQGLESIGFEAYTFFTRYAIFNSPRPFTWSFPNTKSLTYIGKGRDIHDTEVGNAIQDILTSCSPDSIPSRSPRRSQYHQQHLQQKQRRLSADETLLKSRQLKEVTISNCSIRRSLVSAIVDTFGEGLEVLDLVGCGGLSRLNLHQILVRCGNLRVFRGPESFLWTRDMVLSEQHWSSRHLKELVVLIGIGMSLDKDATDLAEMADTTNVKAVLARESTRRSVDVVLNQIAQLEDLEVLDLSGDLDYHLAEDCRKGIPLVLGAGLDKLRGLSKLRRVYISGWEDEMSAKEAEWMNTHWPRLEYIHSREGGASPGWREFLTKLKHPLQHGYFASKLF
ncbi:hypothetical protein BG015_000417 [Linnemannia schmuckeri]|uniref:F-box domain-containing protein n=1 Tax=Linnemannia schmuckeri TaxID=64567 RepID=A0A9P5RRJ3_9FUNG|nr:hypothetical protein BG015_000417 [Linnemannia schmuckeri]